MAVIDARWAQVRRLLVVRLDNLGDLLMTTPALAALRQALPQARMALLASPSGAAALPHLPMLDEAIAYDAPWVRSSAGDGAQADHALLQRLALAEFDAAIVFTVCTQSALPAALLCRLAGIPLRLAHSRENPYGLLSDWVRDADQVQTGMRHEVQRQLDLVRQLGIDASGGPLVFQVPSAHARRWRQRLAAASGSASRPYFAVHVGASAASRRYAPEGFAAAADAIARLSGLMPVFTGGASEQALVEQVRSRMAMPSLALAGALDLGELGALLAGARVLVANNTGPVHMAAALGTPVVVLYAQTNPQHTPWQVPARVLFHDVDCRHCLRSTCPAGHHDCLARVAPADVAAAALELLQAGAREAA